MSDARSELPVILVVDDQADVLATIGTMLRRSGYQVIEALGGANALEVLNARSDVTVLLTDCHMPRISGADLTRIVMQRWPYIRIIAISGQPRSEEMPAEAGFIAKPFRASSLGPLIMAPAEAPVARY